MDQQARSDESQDIRGELHREPTAASQYAAEIIVLMDHLSGRGSLDSKDGPGLLPSAHQTGESPIGYFFEINTRVDNGETIDKDAWCF